MAQREWVEAIPKSVGATCGWCRKDVEMTGASIAVMVGDLKDTQGGRRGVVAGMFLCPRHECRKPSLVFFHAFEGRWTSPSTTMSRVEQFPRGQAQPMKDLPDAIARDRDEAWSCY